MHKSVEPAYGRVAAFLGTDPEQIDLTTLRELAAARGVVLGDQSARVDDEGGTVRTCRVALAETSGELRVYGSGEGTSMAVAMIDAIDAALAERDFQIAEVLLRAEGIDARAESSGERGWARFAIAEPTGDALVARSSAGRKALGPTARLAAQVLLRLGMRHDDAGSRWTWSNPQPALTRRYPRAPIHAAKGLGRDPYYFDDRLPSRATVRSVLADTGAAIPTTGCGLGVAFEALYAFAKHAGLPVNVERNGLPNTDGDWTVAVGTMGLSGFVVVGDPDLASAVCRAIATAHRYAGLRRAHDALTAEGFREVRAVPERHGFVVKLEHVPDHEDGSLILLVSNRSPVVSGREAAVALAGAGFVEVPRWPGRWRAGTTTHDPATEAVQPSLVDPFTRLRRLVATRPNKPTGQRLYVGTDAPVQGFGGARVIFALEGDWRSGPDDFRPDPLVVLTPFCFAAGWLVCEMLACMWQENLPIDKYSLCAAAALGALRYQDAVAGAETERGVLSAMLDSVERAVTTGEVGR